MTNATIVLALGEPPEFTAKLSVPRKNLQRTTAAKLVKAFAKAFASKHGRAIDPADFTIENTAGERLSPDCDAASIVGARGETLLRVRRRPGKPSTVTRVGGETPVPASADRDSTNRRRLAAAQQGDVVEQQKEMGILGNVTMTCAERSSCLAYEGTTPGEGVAPDLMPVVFGGLHNVYLGYIEPRLADETYTAALRAAMEGAAARQRGVAAGERRRVRVAVLGLGTGVLALTAARLGAEVVWVDTLKRFCDVAEEMAAQNRASTIEAVHFAGGGAALSSWRGDGGEPFDVVATECVDDGLFGDHLLLMARAARASLLRRPTGRFLPGRARVWACAVECRTGDVRGFDLGAFDAFRGGKGGSCADAFSGAVRLSPPRVAYEIDFNDPTRLVTTAEVEAIAAKMAGGPEPCTLTAVHGARLRCDRGGVFNAVCAWVALDYGDGGGVDFSPFADGGKRRAIKDVLHYVGYERIVEKGDAVDVTVRVAEDALEIDAPPPRGARRATGKPVLAYHFHMLRDDTRNGAYETAIRRAIQRSKKASLRVLDVGAGTGLLSMMAARAGRECGVAVSCTACEMVPEVAAAAQAIVNANGFAEEVAIVGARSDEIALDPRADLLVTEIFDCALLGEGCIPSIADARRRLLTPAAEIIPRRGGIWCVPLDVMGGRARGGDLDLGALNALGCDGAVGAMRAVCIKLQHLDEGAYARLAEPVRVFDIDFLTAAADDRETRTFEVTFTAPGKLNALLLWFDLDLGEGLPRLANGPDDPELCWDQNLRYLPAEVAAVPGEAVTLVAERDATRFHVRLARVPPDSVPRGAVGHPAALFS